MKSKFFCSFLDSKLTQIINSESAETANNGAGINN